MMKQENIFTNLIYYIKIYIMVASQYIKGRLQYRADFFLSIFGMLLINTSGFAGVWVIMQNIHQIAGWTYYELMFLYGFSTLAMAPQQLFLDNAWQLSDKIVNGEFIKYCFRPINILFYYMSETIDIKGISQLIIGSIILIWSWIKLDIPFTILNGFMFIFLYIGATFVCMGLIILFSSFGFMGGGTNSALFMAADLKDYSKYPLTIFNKFFRGLFTVILPLGFIAYYPAQYFISNGNDISILTYFSTVFGGLFFFIACKTWIHFASRYSGTGS